jgi:hypothetical protein
MLDQCSSALMIVVCFVRVHSGLVRDKILSGTRSCPGQDHRMAVVLSEVVMRLLIQRQCWCGCCRARHHKVQYASIKVR